MRTLSMACAGIALAVLPSGAALAQEFDGPFVGAQAGWESTDLQNPVTEAGTIMLDEDQQGFTGGVYAGYDKTVAPRIVLGIEGSFDLGADDSITSSTSTGLATIDPEWSLDLTGRAGYLLDQKTLAYVRGGYTNARVETTVSGTPGQLVESDNREGWLAGAGIERKLLPNLSARVEYRYSDLGQDGDSWDRHRVLTGLSYRF